MAPRRRHVETSPKEPLASRRSPKDITSPLSPISPWPPLSDEPDSASIQQPSEENDGTPYTVTVQEELPTAKEIYGSIAVLLTGLGYIVYLTWAFLPASTLDKFGWTWYPARDWALIIPCWLMLLVLTTYWCYAAITIYLTPSFDSIEIITDSSALASPPWDGEIYTKSAPHLDGGMPPAVDIPIDIVNRVLYPPRRRTS